MLGTSWLAFINRSHKNIAMDGRSEFKPVRKDFLTFGSPAIGEDEIGEVANTLRSGWVGTGPKTHQFEELFRGYIGARHAIALSSCTAALHLSLVVAGLKQGDEVITTPMTFAATAAAIIHSGATPVFVDCEKDSMNIDPERIGERITKKTKAILPVHFAGRAADMDRIGKIAKENGLLVIEDAAHAIETSYKGRKIGTTADISCFSFYVTKNITTVEGGMATTSNDDYADKIRTYGLHGMSKGAWERYSDKGYRHYSVIFPGFKYNMTDVQASIGMHQIKKIGGYHSRREAIWERYDEAFRDLPVTIPKKEEDDTVHARHLYTILLNIEELDADRDAIMNDLHLENIGTGVHYVSLHLHPYYRQAYGYAPDDFPNAKFISERTLSLPLSAKLSDKDVDDVIQAVRKVIGHHSR